MEPTYHAVHTTLTHPTYAGAYVYGPTRQDHYVAEDGRLRVRRGKLPKDEWEVLITDHHHGFIDWDTYHANQARIEENIRPERSAPGTGAIREGAALLQGLAAGHQRRPPCQLVVCHHRMLPNTPPHPKRGCG